MADLRQEILRLQTLWADYRQKVTVSSEEPAHKIVADVIPAILRSALAGDVPYRIQGSTGAGNITAAPWVGAFDPAITASATKGFYVVYLFSVDMRRLYLSLAFGITQFSEYFSGDQKREKIKSAAANLRAVLRDHEGLLLDSIDLAAGTKNNLHRDYEASSIAAIAYELNDLPDHQRLISDFQRMLQIYRGLVLNPLLPETQSLFEAEVDAQPIRALPIVEEFQPRLAKEARKAGATRRSSNRYSAESKKVGDRGELIVFEHEQRTLLQAGLHPDRVIWHARAGETPGWDISSLDEAGNPIFIEVKASVGRKVDGVLVTENEWRAARAHGDQYRIYLVSNVMSAQPRIEVIRNPASLVEAGTLAVSIAVWSLSFSVL